VHSGSKSSIGEFLIYFYCILTNISVVTYTICFSLQEMYEEEVIKKHSEGFDWGNEPISG
jgi:hypothetical protein